MSTPFSQLGFAKQANAPLVSPFAGGSYNPYGPQQQVTPAPQAPTEPSKPWWHFGMNGRQAGWLAADVGIGSIPVVGTAWNLGRGAYQASQGNWGEAAGNVGLAGLSLVGMGGAGAAARAAMAAGKTAGKVGMMARAGTAIAKAGQGTGVVARGANGLMRAGEASTALNAAGSTIHNGLQVPGAVPLVGGSQVLKPLTAGGLAHGAASTAAVMGPGMILPDATPAVRATTPLVNAVSPYMSQYGGMPQYNGSVAHVMANEMTR